MPLCALLGWNAVATKINEKGQVEGTCVGTGMAFDPAFYYYRPVNVFAAHGYGPVLLAGAEMIQLLHNYSFEINDSSIQLKQAKKIIAGYQIVIIANFSCKNTIAVYSNKLAQILRPYSVNVIKISYSGK